MALAILTTCGKPADKIASYLLEAAESRPELCVDSTETRERIRALLLAGLDDALKDRIMHVFDIWMKDETGQPARARTGTDNAVRGYIGAYQGIQKWSPPICAGQ